MKEPDEYYFAWGIIAGVMLAAIAAVILNVLGKF